MPASIATFGAPGVNVYFFSNRASVNGQPSQHLAQFITGATKSLDCAIYDLKHPDIVKALQTAAKKVKLRIAYDGGVTKSVKGGTMVDPKPSGTEQALKQAGLLKFATAIHVAGRHLMHSKYIVRDGKQVWTGSGNWTHGGLDLQDNNYLAIQSPALAAAYEASFTFLISPAHVHPTKPKTGAVAPVVKLGSITMSPYFSGGGVETEQLETVIVDRMKKAKKIRLIAMLVSDLGILQALKAFQPAGKDIRGILDPHEMKQVMHPPKGKSKKDPALFWFANGDKRFVAAPTHAYSPSDNNDFMHNKIMILDGRTLVVGSYNFSENAESNDENILVIESPAMAAAYQKYFDAMFAQYTKHGAKLPPI